MRLFTFTFALHFLLQAGAYAACPVGDYVCADKMKDWKACKAAGKPNCGPEPTKTPPQGFKVVGNNGKICEADDGQTFPCGEPTPLHDDRKPYVKPANRAKGWEADKDNGGMFGEQANRDAQKGSYSVVYDPTVQSSNEQDKYKIVETTGGAFQSQTDAFVAHNNVLIGCTATNINGRSDNLCTLTPNHPECTGLNITLKHAVFCTEPPPPGSPPGTPCKSYGAFDYNIDEWLVFGQHYFDGMTTCVSQTGGTTDRRDRMVAITDIVSMTPGAGSDYKNGSSASNITGQAKVINAETRAKEMTERFDDGAAYLGLNKGDLILKAYKGESFLSAFSDSPFAESLSKKIRETVDYALGNPEEKMAAAKEKRLAELEKKKAELEAKGEPTITGTERSLASAAPEAAPRAGGDSSSSGSRAASESAVGRGQRAGQLANQLAGLRQDSSGKSVLYGGPGSYGDKGQEKGASPGATDAGTAQATGSGIGEADEASLFQRVSISYRRYAPELSAYGESKAARDVRLTETPELFRDL